MRIPGKSHTVSILHENKKFRTLFRLVLSRKQTTKEMSNALKGEKQRFSGREAMLCSPKSAARLKTVCFGGFEKKCSKSRFFSKYFNNYFTSENDYATA